MKNAKNKSDIILFDGICNLCNSSINFIIQHDKNNRFKFAAIQSEIGKSLLTQFDIDTLKTDSIILIQNNKVHIKSSAILRIAKHLNGLYPLCYLFIVVPPIVRNLFYDVVARNRYGWFGRKDACMIPTDALKSKFIS